MRELSPSAKLQDMAEMAIDLIDENELMEMDILDLYTDSTNVELKKYECKRRHEQQRETIRSYLREA